MTSNRTLLSLAAGVLLVAGCDIPTDVPIIEQRWVIPVEETTLSVAELLPSGVTVAGGGFDVAVDPFTASTTLGQVCGVCINGITAPTPAFDFTFSTSAGLPADVSSATITSATINLAITNGFSFDPIVGGGALTVTLSDGPGGAQLGQVVVDGASTSFSPGATVNRTLSIGAATVGASLFASVRVVSVGGQTATINTSEQVSVAATATSFVVGSATVNVGTRTVDLDPVSIDVEGIDSSITDRIQRGTITLAANNPFAVSVSGTIRIGSTSKSFQIAASGPSTVTLDYSAEELRSFLGQPGVTFSGSGSATGGAITITPDQEMTFEATLDITIQIG